jgi:hypothetical protein
MSDSLDAYIETIAWAIIAASTFLWWASVDDSRD